MIVNYQAAGRCVDKTGSTLLVENAFARVDRGAGLPNIKRVPYFPPEAKKEIQSYSGASQFVVYILPLLGFLDSRYA